MFPLGTSVHALVNLLGHSVSLQMHVRKQLPIKHRRFWLLFRHPDRFTANNVVAWQTKVTDHLWSSNFICVPDVPQSHFPLTLYSHTPHARHWNHSAFCDKQTPQCHLCIASSS